MIARATCAGELELTRNVQLQGFRRSRTNTAYGSRLAGRCGMLAILVVLVMMNLAAPQLPGEADNNVLVDRDSGSEAATHKARILISVSRQSTSYILHAR